MNWIIALSIIVTTLIPLIFPVLVTWLFDGIGVDKYYDSYTEKERHRVWVSWPALLTGYVVEIAIASVCIAMIYWFG